MLRILQLEDDPVDAQLTLRLLREGGLDLEIERVHTFSAFKRGLEHSSPALILADYTVPGVDAFKALEVARQIQPGVPFIFLSGTLGEDVAIETLKMGATDYVLKQRMGRLVPAVRRSLQEAKVQRERQRAEQELRASEDRYRALVELAPDAVVVFQHWHFVYLNAAALRLFGADALDRLWGKQVLEFVPAPEQELVRQSAQSLLQGATIPLREIRLRRLDGCEVPVEVAGSRVEWLGQPAVQAILRDITERKRIERELAAVQEQLLHANLGLEQTVRERTAELREAIEDLHRFSYAIIHDMRAPLRAMHSFASLMQEECSSCELTSSLTFLQRIKAAAERLDQLIQDALNYSKVLQEKLPLVPVDVGRLLRDIVESYPQLQPSVAEVAITDPLPAVLGSQAALTQCFGNLLDNAVKFVAPGVRPRIRIWAENLAPEPGAPRDPEHPLVRFWIQDNGIGIAPDQQAYVFEMFHRLDPRYPGTGIGLAIVRKAVERMGGRVGLKSVPGHGSRFWLDLRLITTSDPDPRSLSKPNPGKAGTAKIEKW